MNAKELEKIDGKKDIFAIIGLYMLLFPIIILVPLWQFSPLSFLQSMGVSCLMYAAIFIFNTISLIAGLRKIIKDDKQDE